MQEKLIDHSELQVTVKLNLIKLIYDYEYFIYKKENIEKQESGKIIEAKLGYLTLLRILELVKIDILTKAELYCVYDLINIAYTTSGFFVLRTKKFFSARELASLSDLLYQISCYVKFLKVNKELYV